MAAQPVHSTMPNQNAARPTTPPTVEAVKYTQGRVLKPVLGLSALPPSLSTCDHPFGSALFLWLFVEAARRKQHTVCCAVSNGRWDEALALGRYRDGTAHLEIDANGSEGSR